MNQTFLMSDLSKRLNVPPYRIAYLLTTRQLPEPKRIGNRRTFSLTEARQVAKALGVPWNPDQSGKEEHGQ
jgi:hypothetical protein